MRRSFALCFSLLLLTLPAITSAQARGSRPLATRADGAPRSRELGGPLGDPRSSERERSGSRIQSSAAQPRLRHSSRGPGRRLRCGHPGALIQHLHHRGQRSVHAMGGETSHAAGSQAFFPIWSLLYAIAGYPPQIQRMTEAVSARVNTASG
jgi:hypothetical protein